MVTLMRIKMLTNCKRIYMVCGCLACFECHTEGGMKLINIPRTFRRQHEKLKLKLRHLLNRVVSSLSQLEYYLLFIHSV